jgi:hypothetical protein
MKASERGKLLRNVVGSNSKFKAKGSLAELVPTQHFLRAIYLDRSSDPSAFYIEVFILPLFVPTEHLYFNFGFRLLDSKGLDSWYCGKPNLVNEMQEMITATALPFLEKVKSPADFVKMELDNTGSRNLNNREALAYSYIVDRKMAHAIHEIDCILSEADTSISWQALVYNRANSLKSLINLNPNLVQKQFDKWEVASKEKLKLM